MWHDMDWLNKLNFYIAVVVDIRDGIRNILKLMIGTNRIRISYVTLYKLLLSL